MHIFRDEKNTPSIDLCKEFTKVFFDFPSIGKELLKIYNTL